MYLCGLEVEPKRKLHHARRLLARQTGDDAKVAVNRARIGQPEVRMVENVVGFRPELKSIPLADDRKILGQCQIQIREVRPVQRVPVAALQPGNRGEGRGGRRLICEELERATRLGRVNMDVRSDLGLGSREKHSRIRGKTDRVVEGDRGVVHGKGQPRAPRLDSGNLPAPDGFVQQSARVSAENLAAAEGQVIHEICADLVPRVEF